MLWILTIVRKRCITRTFKQQCISQDHEREPILTWIIMYTFFIHLDRILGVERVRGIRMHPHPSSTCALDSRLGDVDPRACVVLGGAKDVSGHWQIFRFYVRVELPGRRKDSFFGPNWKVLPPISLSTFRFASLTFHGKSLLGFMQLVNNSWFVNNEM